MMVPIRGGLADAAVPAALLLEDDWVDGEEHIEEGVDSGDVDGDQKGDRILGRLISEESGGFESWKGKRLREGADDAID